MVPKMTFLLYTPIIIYSDVRHEGFTYCIMVIITEVIKAFVILQQV